jgi:uncharacterized protein
LWLVITPDRDESVPPEITQPLRGPVLLEQTLRDMFFVHWPLEAESVRHLFPDGTRPDTFGGRTYVGVVGFAVPSIRLGGAVDIGSMHELNVRLYSIDDAGRQGVIFRSMDVTRPDMVLAARLLIRLPYQWSYVQPMYQGRRTVAGLRVQRRLTTQIVGRFEVDVGDVVPQPSAFEVFLTARWGLHARTLRGTTWVPITHPPFVLHRARLLHADEALLVAAGIPAPGHAPVGVLWSPGLDVQIGRPVRLRS